MRRILFVASVLSVLSGCNWSDLDVEFLAALPDKADLKVTPPTRSGQALTSGDLGERKDGLAGSDFLNLQGTADQINAMIDGLTGGLDFVRQFPPSKREPDLRAWGPYADKEKPGFELQVEITRSQGAGVEYVYEVQWRKQKTQDPFVAVIRGTFKGEKAANGVGEFVLDLEKARSLGWRVDPGMDPIARVRLGYSHAEGTDVKLTLEALKVGTDSSFHHLSKADGSGRMTYTTENTAWTFEANANWLPSRAGRVDAKATRKWIGTGGLFTECWDASLTTVYWSQDYADDRCANDEGCTTGEPSACLTAATTAW